MKISIVPKGRPSRIMQLHGMGLIYAEKNGGLVLKGETSWRKVSGFWVNTKWGCVWVELRRVSG